MLAYTLISFYYSYINSFKRLKKFTTASHIINDWLSSDVCFLLSGPFFLCLSLSLLFSHFPSTPEQIGRCFCNREYKFKIGPNSFWIGKLKIAFESLITENVISLSSLHTDLSCSLGANLWPGQHPHLHRFRLQSNYSGNSVHFQLEPWSANGQFGRQLGCAWNLQEDFLICSLEKAGFLFKNNLSHRMDIVFVFMFVLFCENFASPKESLLTLKWWLCVLNSSECVVKLKGNEN